MRLTWVGSTIERISREESQMQSSLVGELSDERTSRGRDQDRSGSRARLEDRLRVVVADTDVLSRHALAILLESMDMSVVGRAGSVPTLLDLVRSHNPALVVVHQRLRTAQGDGVDAALAVKQAHPEVGIVVLVTHIEVEPAATLLATGEGIGYVLKQRVNDVEDFAGTLHQVARGGSVVDPALVHEMVAAGRHHDPLEFLSPRERDVLSQMAAGRSNYGVAEALWVTPATVEKHVHSILTKLELPDGPADHRRVLAVLTFLDRQPPGAAASDAMVTGISARGRRS
jgi:DNA-binding NarL/FixJ family response regulator